jgi:hypothetical protein
MSMSEPPYRNVKFEIGATFDGSSWVGEFVIYKKMPDGTLVQDAPYKPAPGAFTNKGAAIDAAREHTKRLIDTGAVN